MATIPWQEAVRDERNHSGLSGNLVLTERKREEKEEQEYVPLSSQPRNSAAITQDLPTHPAALPLRHALLFSTKEELSVGCELYGFPFPVKIQ